MLQKQSDETPWNMRFWDEKKREARKDRVNFRVNFG
jgi:hypothetical protein